MRKSKFLSVLTATIPIRTITVWRNAVEILFMTYDVNFKRRCKCNKYLLINNKWIAKFKKQSLSQAN